MSQEYELLQARKRRYIPLCCAGRLTEKQAAEKIGIHPYSVSRLKKRYRLHGDAVFTNAHKGKSYQQKKFSDMVRKEICALYRSYWAGSNFAAFRDRLEQFHHIKICTPTLTDILEADGIYSPRKRWPKKEKKKHSPRKEREHTGELLQFDASEYDWLMNGERITLHGAIDDASHEPVGLWFCRNECRLGYSEVLRQTLTDKGMPEAVYIDRHAAFVKNARKDWKTMEERLEYSREEDTHWTGICDRMKSEIILALSPEAKGRIERLWETLQGRLPQLFRFLGIGSIDEANAFLPEYIRMYRERFAVPPQKTGTRYRPCGMSADELEYLLAVKIPRRTRWNGEFTFHGFTFRLEAVRAACRDFTLCLSEKGGVRAWLDGRYYPVSLVDELTDCVGDTMPQVEKDLVARYLLSDTHRNIYRFTPS